MALNRKRRIPAPCKDREAVYETMAKWTFEEVNEMNANLLDWIEKTALVFEPTLSKNYEEILPQNFLTLLERQNGIWLERLAIRLGTFKSRLERNRSSYEVFYDFARNEAKLAEGCIFLPEELLGDSHTYEDYKSVFYTLFKLANQARQKFGVPTLAETRELGWPELNKRKLEVRKKCADRVQLCEVMGNWSFDEVEKKNQEIIAWLGGGDVKNETPSVADSSSSASSRPQFAGISPKDFLHHLASAQGKAWLGKLSNPVEYKAEEFYDNFYAYAKERLPDECIFWENELHGASYEDYKSVFCTLYMLMTSFSPATTNSNAIEEPTSSILSSNSQIEQQISSTTIPTANSNSKDRFVLYVKTLSGKTIVLNCLPKHTIFRLKAILHEREGIPPHQQTIIYAGRRLNDDMRMQDYNLQDGSTVHVFVEMRGC